MKIDLSHNSLSILRASGWSESRQIDVEHILATAGSKPELHAFGIDVIQSFDHIIVPCHVKDEQGTYEMVGTLQFNFASALAFFVEDDLSSLQRESGLWLVPFAERDLLVFLASEDGRIVLLDKHWLGYEILPSLECALENSIGVLDRYDGPYVHFD